MNKIYDATSPKIRHTNEELYNKMKSYLDTNKTNLEKLSNRLLEISPEIYFGFVEWKDLNHNEMYLTYDGYSTDTFKCKTELIYLYRDCFHKWTSSQIGPSIICEQQIVEISKYFGRNYCDNHPNFIYTKLDTNTVKSRYPNLPFYSKERQPGDSECVFVWQIDDNWYMISD